MGLDHRSGKEALALLWGEREKVSPVVSVFLGARASCLHPRLNGGRRSRSQDGEKDPAGRNGD